VHYRDLQEAIYAFEAGHNVSELMRTRRGAAANTPDIIEIAYDLQAGTYIEGVRADEAGWTSRVSEMADVLRPLAAEAQSILEAGTGEMTTLTGVANACYRDGATAYACDLSWSRLEKGRGFARERLRNSVRLEPFVADIFHLPLQNASVDLVWTSHALEPNGGREREAVRELMRVARRSVVLFEPSYENNTDAGRARMERHGYIRGLRDAVEAEGGVVERDLMLEHSANPLNPTRALVLRPPPKARAARAGLWACPTTGLPMERRDDCFWSERAVLAYPVLGGIPVLRPEAAILASAMLERVP
jgi:SAM-dependent methyltransferase